MGRQIFWRGMSHYTHSFPTFLLHRLLKFVMHMPNSKTHSQRIKKCGGPSLKWSPWHSFTLPPPQPPPTPTPLRPPPSIHIHHCHISLFLWSLFLEKGMTNVTSSHIHRIFPLPYKKRFFFRLFLLLCVYSSDCICNCIGRQPICLHFYSLIFLRFGGCMPLFLHRHFFRPVFFMYFFHTASSSASQIPLCRRLHGLNPVAKFIVSEWGIFWLWHRVVVPACQPICSLEGPVRRQPYAGVNFIPSVREYEYGYMTVTALALAVRLSNLSAKSHPDITCRTVLLHKKPGPQR